jgi:ABC-type sugar transport system ATPase subunit
MDELAARGLAILLISDEVEEVRQQAHRILVMLGGRIAGEYPPSGITDDQLREAIDA